MKKLNILTRIRRKFEATLKGRSGQSTTEYILILAIVVMIASKMKTQLQGAVGKGVDNLSNVIDQQTRDIGSTQ